MDENKSAVATALTISTKRAKLSTIIVITYFTTIFVTLSVTSLVIKYLPISAYVLGFNEDVLLKSIEKASHDYNSQQPHKKLTIDPNAINHIAKYIYSKNISRFSWGLTALTVVVCVIGIFIGILMIKFKHHYESIENKAQNVKEKIERIIEAIHGRSYYDITFAKDDILNSTQVVIYGKLAYLLDPISAPLLIHLKENKIWSRDKKAFFIVPNNQGIAIMQLAFRFQKLEIKSEHVKNLFLGLVIKTSNIPIQVACYSNHCGSVEHWNTMNLIQLLNMEPVSVIGEGWTTTPQSRVFKEIFNRIVVFIDDLIPDPSKKSGSGNHEDGTAAIAGLMFNGDRIKEDGLVKMLETIAENIRKINGSPIAWRFGDLLNYCSDNCRSCSCFSGDSFDFASCHAIDHETSELKLTTKATSFADIQCPGQIQNSHG